MIQQDSLQQRVYWSGYGISDCFHTSDGRAISSMSPVIDFYHGEMPLQGAFEPSRNKKRKIKHF